MVGASNGEDIVSSLLKDKAQKRTDSSESVKGKDYGRFYGNPVVVLPQRHKINSTEFVLDDDVLTIVATGDKPIKFIREGDPLVIMGDPLNNADLTQEFMYAEKYGIGIVLAGSNPGIGRYDMSVSA